MSPYTVYIITLAVLAGCIVYLDVKHNLLRDTSTATHRPYSFSRVQLAWWTIIILASFASIIMAKGVPTLDGSTLILLGISSATTGAGRITDLSDQTNQNARSQDEESDGFFLDLLSDKNGVSIHRFQALVFNATFGIWFVSQVWTNLPVETASRIIPVIDTNNLILLGLSSGTYAALKVTENKSTGVTPPEYVRDEATSGSAQGEG